MTTLGMAELKQEELEEIRKYCLKSFRFFVQTFLPREFYDPDFHGPLCDFVQYASTPDICVVMPRTHLKTTIVGTLYPVWKVVNWPDIRVLLVSNTFDNASKTVHEIKGFFEENSFFAMLFPEVIPDFRMVRWSDACAEVARSRTLPEGTFEAAGTGTKITRRHYNLIIEDDTVAPDKSEMGGLEQMPTRENIEKAIGFHKGTIPLLIRVGKDRRVVIGTRWSHADLINEVMTKEDAKVSGGRFSTYSTSALKEDGSNAYKRFSLEDLDGIRKSMSEYMWSMLYLNQPLSEEFLKFKPRNTRYWKPGEVPAEGVRVVTVDPADPPTGKGDQCYTAAVACLRAGGNLYVLGYERGRYSEFELITKVLDLADKHDCLRVRVEVDRYPHLEAGFKIAMAKRKKQYIMEPVKTRGRGKEDRITRLTPIHENQMLFLKEGMRELETEMYQFPRGSTIDLLDALAWQVLDDFYVPTEKAEKRVEKPRGRYTFEQIMKGLARHECRLPFERQLARFEGRSFFRN